MNPLKTLLYFSIFKYPLQIDEVFEYSNTSSIEETSIFLEEYLNEGVIFKIGNYYLCENEPSYIDRRLKGNQMAKAIFYKAEKVSKFIAKFPYVSAVGISGSLSKGYYDENGDIDFFIITSSNRLWIARTLLILYKKLFLFNSKKYFCVNYFVSEDALEIQEKNQFTATEVVTLIPMYGQIAFQKFYEKNRWINSFYTNKNVVGIEQTQSIKKSWAILLFQQLLQYRIGDYIDHSLLKLTLRKWKQKFSHLDAKNFKVAMKSTKNISKHHPQNYQKKVIDILDERYEKVLLKIN